MDLRLPLIFLIFSTLFVSGVRSRSFIMENKCEYTVWPGLLSNAGIPPVPTTGFILQKGESRTIQAPASWGGRFWGRTQCSNSTDGIFTCLTGDCGSGKIECSGSGAIPPATLAEFTLDGYAGLDFYDVSLVDGYNVPMLVVPQGGSGLNCNSTGCVADLNESCPSELKVTTTSGGGSNQTMACKSACEAFRTPEYCCSGSHGTPDTCKPTSYSLIFKTACPRAYSYAYDDQSSTFTCSQSPNYLITFCPSSITSQKSSNVQSPAPATTSDGDSSPAPATNSDGDSSPTPMINEGDLEQSKKAPCTMMHQRDMEQSKGSPSSTKYQGDLEKSKGSVSTCHLSLGVTIALVFCRMLLLF